MKQPEKNMPKHMGGKSDTLPDGWTRWLALAGIVMGSLLVVISCSTLNRTVVQLPNVPGATYIGSDQCDTCHDNIYKDFATPTMRV